jgi:hypothetical protein
VTLPDVTVPAAETAKEEKMNISSLCAYSKRPTAWSPGQRCRPAFRVKTHYPAVAHEAPRDR